MATTRAPLTYTCTDLVGNMAAPYTIPNYLLDKENIRDTVLRMMFAYDERDSETLVNAVYTPEVTINYDATLLGNGSEDMSSTEWAKRLEHLHDRFDTTQHIVHNLLVKLPQPSATGTGPRPEICKVVAYAHGIFYKRDDEGRPTIMARRQGGRYDLELVRLDLKEDSGENEGNPWRIKVQNVRLDWQDRTEH
ncbi:hypothetical protein PG987_005806 [Apiospora arundinis]